MSEPEQYVELQADDPEWIRQRLESRSGDARVVLKPIDDDLDIEGHAMGSTLRLQAFDDEDDTEGHAISVHFPSGEEAAAFRRRLVLTGALTGTLVVGAAGGFGLANIANNAAAGGAAVTNAVSAPGMDWTQAERPVEVTGAAGGAAAPGMDWTQAERPGAAATEDTSGGPNAPARGTDPVPE